MESTNNANSEAKPTQTIVTEHTKDDLRRESCALIKKGYFMPRWNERGGKNSDLILDMKKPEKESSFYRFYEKEIDYNKIVPLKKNI